jgi:DnaJ-class molecular chaperone
MNFNEAKTLLELPDNFNNENVKQNYHQLSLKHHPDKGGDTQTFVKIKQAYEYLTKNQQPKENVINLNDIFRTFINGSNIFKKPSFFGFKKEITLNISPKEFLTSTTKEIEVVQKTNCSCEQQFCSRCRGFSFNHCTICLGAGIVQQCEKCLNGFITTKQKQIVDIPKANMSPIVLESVIINLKLSDPKFFVKDNKLYYRYNISLKESLTGFKKTFKDPFEIEHQIVSNTIVKQNDGYFINDLLYIVFNIVYPKKLLTQLKNIDF